MKPAALKFLVCPACLDSLDLVETLRRGGEVLEGDLRCPRCVVSYPIRRGVPRFVSSGQYAGSFGFQWTRFERDQLDSFTGDDESDRTCRSTTGWTAHEVRGATVLDAGVGAGRYAEVVARMGGEVFGVDITEAVDSAYRNIGERPGVHLAQADIFRMPFRPSTFDGAYSIGVLHHTPDPRAAFEHVARTVRVGGKLAVFLYPNSGVASHFPNLIRKVTTRLPLRAMRVLSTVAVPLYYPYRIPALGKIFHLVAPISMHRRWRVRWLDTFDWYTPKYQWKLTHPEVFAWFRDNGFDRIEIAPDPIRMRGVRARDERPEVRV